MGLEAMTKTEMLEILRGKVLQESPDEIQQRLNEIADELEQSDRVVRCKDCIYNEIGSCEKSEDCDPNFDPMYFCSDGEKMDEESYE